MDKFTPGEPMQILRSGLQKYQALHILYCKDILFEPVYSGLSRFSTLSRQLMRLRHPREDLLNCTVTGFTRMTESEKGSEPLKQEGTMKSVKNRDIYNLLLDGELHLACSQCRYDLYGLSGETKTCPECGSPNSLDVESITTMELWGARHVIDHSYPMLVTDESVTLCILLAALGFAFLCTGSFCLSLVLISLSLGAIMLWYELRQQLQSILTPEQFRQFVTTCRTGAKMMAVVKMGFAVFIELIVRSALSKTNADEAKVFIFISIPIYGAMLYWAIQEIRKAPKDELSEEEREQLNHEISIRLAQKIKWKKLLKRIHKKSLRAKLKELQKQKSQ